MYKYVYTYIYMYERATKQLNYKRLSTTHYIFLKVTCPIKQPLDQSIYGVELYT